MNNTIKVSKYLFNDLKKSMLIFYGIILAIAAFMVFIYARVSLQPGYNVRFAGLGYSSVIFLFISGLNCFRANFKFMQANNVSRKRLYFGFIITLISAAAFMSLVDAALNNLLKQLIPYEGVFEQLYNKDFFFADFFWSFALFSLAASLGWVITMLYYKCDKLMKTVISIAPIFVIIILIILDNMSMGVIYRSIVDFLSVALGFTSLNSYMAVFSFFIASAVMIACGFLLIRRMPIKD